MTERVDLPTVPLAGLDIITAVVTAYEQGYGMTKSRSDVRRLVEGGSIQWQGQKITDAKAKPDFQPGGVLKLDKLRAVHVG